MEKAFIVSLSRPQLGYLPLHVFTGKQKAKRYAVNYLYSHSTLEDQEAGIQADEYDHFTEYSLYTTQYGYITLQVKEINID